MASLSDEAKEMDLFRFSLFKITFCFLYKNYIRLDKIKKNFEKVFK